MPLVESITRALRSNRFRTTATTILCCLVLVLGIRNVSQAFLRHVDHPGWDFTLRHGEVSCLTSIHVDPYDIFSGTIKDASFLPFKLRFYEQDAHALDYHWCAGYPPWEYTLLLPFSFITLQTANAIYKGLELAALFCVFFFAFRRSTQIGSIVWKRCILTFSFLLMQPEAWNYAFKYDNWAILFCAGVACLIFFLNKGWQFAAGLAWAFLMIKPQQGIWFAIPLLFRRQFRTIGVATAICLLASLPPAILCGKSPIELILEIPKFRLQPYFWTSLFPPQVFCLAGECFFPKAALVFGAILCLGFSLWATWKIRKETDWFIFFQPTFFCVCAGYPLWYQDRLFYFFPIVFLLEIWMGNRAVSRQSKMLAFVLVVLLVNPFTWIRHDFTCFLCTLVPPNDILVWSTWLLSAFLIHLIQKENLLPIDSHPSSILFSPKTLITPTDIFCSERKCYDSTLKSCYFVLAVAVLGLAYVAFLKNGRIFGIVNADYFCGYAQNLLGEDTTSQLWFLLNSLCFRLYLGKEGVLAVSLVLLLATQWIWVNTLYKVLPSQCRSPFFLFLYSVILLSSAGYITWMSITLTDTVLTGFLLAWMTSILVSTIMVSSIRSRCLIVSAVPFALAPLAGSEMMMVAPCCLALGVLCRVENGKSWKGDLIRGVAFLCGLLILIESRIWHFGYFLPSMYHMKSSSWGINNIQEGTQYAFGYLRSGVFPTIFSICLAIAIARMIVRPFRKSAGVDRAPPVDFLWMWCIVVIIPPILSGGDHFNYFRLFQPAWPLVCVMLLFVLASFSSFSPPQKSEPEVARIIVLFSIVFFSFFSGWKQLGRNPAWSHRSPLYGKFLAAQKDREIDAVSFQGTFRFDNEHGENWTTKE